MTRHRIMGLLGMLCLASSAAAAGLDEMPEALQGWESWALYDTEFRQCPVRLRANPQQPGSYLCAWPGLLEVHAETQRGRFEIRWRVYEESWVPLPGGERAWPVDVQVDGEATTVTIRNERPHLLLPPGQFRVSGGFRWDQRPQVLEVPDAVARIDLTVDGQPVAAVARDRGNLWLGERRSETAPQAASASVVVQRRFADGIPLTVVTRIQLQIAGAAREEVIGQPLLEGFVPTALHSDLPLRLDETQQLVAQVRPGSWTIELQARALRLPGTLTLGLSGGLWPEEEIWTFAANPVIRVAAMEGVPAVDPQQVGVYPPWAQLPTFVVRPGDAASVVERTRGMARDEGNRLWLNRQLWLDFDGSGYSLLDSVSGQMRQGWRLDLAQPVAMTSAESGNAPLLITSMEPGLSGVELRNPEVSLTVGGRIEGAPGALPVGGYRDSLEQVNTELNLPPGYRLVAALNVDQSPGSWINGWSLLDLFLVLISGAIFWRVFSPPLGLAAGAYLLLAYHESGPVWSLLIAAACIGVLPLLSGTPARLLRMARNVTLLTLAVLAVPFAASQLRMALYPQLERGDYGMDLPGLTAPLPQAAAPVETFMEEQVAADMAVRSAPEPAPSSLEVAPKRAATKRPEPLSRYSPGAVVQAGYGRPAWRWNRYRLEWGGPVLPDQDMRLLIAPPWLISALRVIAVGLFGLLLGRVFLASFKVATLRRVAMGTLVWLAVPGGVMADIPDSELIDTLRQRLLEPPECSPRCGLIEMARVEANGEQLTLSLKAHAQDLVALPLPAASDSWIWRTLRLNGQPLGWIHRDANDIRWLVLEPGLHEISIQGPLTAGENFSLQFPERPQDVEASVEDWELSGLVNRRLPGGGLNFVRVRPQEASAEASFTSQPLNTPNFVRVQRHLRFDLEWTLQTQVQRVSPGEGSLTVDLPLLQGETVTSADFEVDQGRVTVSFAPGQSAQWIASRLEPASSLTLTAGDEDHFVETWQVVVSPVWHLESEGLPTSPPGRAGSTWSYDYYPRRGESLTLDLIRPEAVGGHSVAIDSASLGLDAGRRAADARLTLDIRASRGDQHPIQLPPDARIDEVRINGAEPLNIRSEQGRILIPLSPGSQRVELAWQENREAGLMVGSSEVDLGAPTSNIDLNINLPADRWVLLARGPQVGPAVLLWGEILVMILVAWGLGRSTRTPLKFHHWLLLGIGFSTLSWLSFLMVIAWLFLLAWRRERRAEGPRWRFNGLQIILSLATLLALGVLVAAIPFGLLLGHPDMHIVGNGSTARSLRWFADGSDGVLPMATAISVPLWWYKGAMLAWALWLSSALLRWLPWAWQCLNADRFWMGKVKVADSGPSKSEIEQGKDPT